MQPTSHFLAVSLKAELFADLFISLQKFCKENQIEKYIELQNPLSLHITLYYLDKQLTDSEQRVIQTLLAECRSKYTHEKITISRHDSFLVNDKQQLVFLAPDSTFDLSLINIDCKGLLPNLLAKNQFVYTPHITLFTINDAAQYSQYSMEIESLITQQLKLIEKLNAFVDFNLYAVDSNYSPQIQIAQ